jgi:ABC-2 type transport system permease protein
MNRKMPLWLLTKKNIKLLLRAKGSALIIIFAPLILMLVLGLSFNSSSTYGINIGIYSPAITDDVQNFIDLLKEESFTITTYDSLDSCINEIKSGNTHTCIDLPESLNVEGNEKKEVIFHVDPSRINLVWMVQETVNEKFDLRSQEISQSLTQNILGKLSETKSVISETESMLNTAKGKADSSASSATSTKSSLSGLDLAVIESDVNSTTIGSVDVEVSASNDLISEARDKIKETTLDNTTKQSILDTLTGARNKLNEAERVLTTNGTGGNLLTQLHSDLVTSQNKLKTAATKIGTSNSNLESIAANLQETASSIGTVKDKLTSLKSSIDGVSVTEASTITSPLVTKVEMVGEEGTFLNYLFPALIVLVIMFSSLLLGTTLVMMERNSPAFLRNFFLPVRKITFITSIYLTNLILNSLQIVIILGISLIFLKQALPNLHYIALVLLLASSVFTFIGMVIGYVFNTEETSVLATISLGSLFLLFSGTILPLESTSAFIKGIAIFNPFVLTEKIVREVFLFSTPIQSLWTEIAILAGYAVVFFIIILFIETILHQHTVRKYLKSHHRAHRQKDKKNKNDG